MIKDKKIVRALLSVSDKTGLIEFAEGLVKHKIQILSTGGTARTLKEAGIAITDVSFHTNFPEIMDGRVKTLHPKVHGGILADRDNEKHILAMETHSISPIDIVIVNLYPFVKTINSEASVEDCIENIDIGGPSMIRSAAKNHKYITIVTNVDQYATVLEEMNSNGGVTKYKTRRQFALEAFTHTAQYDAHISLWLSKQVGEEFPSTMFNVGELKEVLRYGENPHQKAAIYTTYENRTGVTKATQLQGKPLSYNNLNDSDVAFEMVCEYGNPACAIIKHANPCGIAVGADVSEAWKKALSSDPVSAFGGVVAFNSEVDANLVDNLGNIFIEVIIATKFTAKALEKLQVRQNLRLLETGDVCNIHDGGDNVKTLAGGLLVQSRDSGCIKQNDCEVVTKRKPTEKEWNDLLFAWKACKHVKSNGITYARDGQTVGIGVGQMSRVDSARIGAEKAELFEKVKNSVVASDAFFPFADGLNICIDAGITAVIQPGGSRNDKEVIDVANEAGIAMVFTGMRHFRH